MEDLRNLLDEYDELAEQTPEEQDIDRYETLLSLIALFGDIDDVRAQAEDDPTLIPDDEFEDYARQLAEDIGAISGDEGWPLSYIDWERAADALKQDYSCIEWDGTDYYYRSV